MQLEDVLDQHLYYLRLSCKFRFDRVGFVCPAISGEFAVGRR